MKNTLTLLLIFLFGLTRLSHAVDYMSIIDSMLAQGATFADITHAVDEAWEGKFQGKHSGRKQYERWKFYQSTRLTPDGHLTNSAINKWDAFYASSNKISPNKAASNFSGNWTSLGKTAFNHYPQGYSGGMGRVNCIAFDPDDNNVIYVGTPGGGLWRTTDGGSSWNPMIDGMPRLGVSGIAIDPSSPVGNRTIYILTGDGDGYDVESLGVYKSVDDGATWMSSGLGASIVNGYKLLMHPSNYNILYAATYQGIYKTENGGLNWTLQTLPNYLDLDRVTDIEFNTVNPEILYATTLKSSVYTTINGGNTWAKMSGTVLPTEAEVYQMRAAVAVTPANPNYIYILYGSILSGNRFGGLYRSTDGGQSFTMQSNYPNILGGDINGLEVNGQSNYDLTLAVSPLNANEVFVGAINSWKSIDGGVTWANTAHWVEYIAGAENYTHADYHALEFDSDHNLYCGTDGGIYKSTDFAENWSNLSFGLEITQFYRIGGKSNNPDMILGGAQDNGSMLMDHTNTMHQWYGGDGFECMFSPDQEGTFYGSYQRGGLFKTINNGLSRYLITPRDENGNERIGKWLTPYTLDPTDSDVIYAGYDDVFKSTNGGSSWTNITNGAILPTWKCWDIKVSRENPDCIYLLKTQELHRTTDGGVTWDYIIEPIPQNYKVLGFTIDPNDIDKIWAYNSLGVYKTTDGGQTWTLLTTTGLPNQWKNTIVYQEGSNDGVYLGTDAGIFYIDNNMDSWLNFSNGLVNVEIYELEIHYQSKKIRAATYGRGVWESDLYINCDDGTTVSVPAPAKSANKAIGISYVIEAESFIETWGTYNDSPYGGPGYGVNSTGTNINYVNTNDYAKYTIPANIEDGVYEVVYHISTPTSGTTISLSVDDGTPIMTDAVTNNGEWDNYQPMTASDQITLQNGINNTITLTASGTPIWEWNLDRFVLTKVDEITIPVSGVTVSDDALLLEIGNSHQLSATITPNNATNQNVTWTSDNTGVATVTNGFITAVSAGDAHIIVTTVSGNHTDTCFVTVEPESYQFTIEAEDRAAFSNPFEIYQSSVGIAVNANAGQQCSFVLPAGYQSGEYRIEYLIGTAVNGATIEINVDNTAGDFIGPIVTDVPNLNTWDTFEWVAASEKVQLDRNHSTNIFVRAEGPAGKAWNMDKLRFVRVGDLNIPVEEFIYDGDSDFNVESGYVVELRGKINPVNSTNNNVSWTSSNPDVAPVPNSTYYDNLSGVVSGVVVTANSGIAVITATTDDGGFELPFTITVTAPVVPVTGVTLSDHNETLTVGETFQLNAMISPADATNANVTWSSDNETAVSVNNNGLVTALTSGNATVKVTTLDGGFSDSCTISVPMVFEYTVEAESFIATGGTVNDAVWGGPGYGYAINGSTINWCNTGDWVDYSVNIPTSGRYEIVYYLATAINGAAIETSINGVAYLTDQVASTGNWEVYQPVTASKYFELYAGNYTIRLRGVGTQGWEWNMDKFTLTRIDEICESNANLKAYYSELPGTYAGPMPGLIQEVDTEEEAEEFEYHTGLTDYFGLYPNPANAQVTVSFNVLNSENVNIQIMNIVGEVKATVVNQQFDTGSYEMVYDLTNMEPGIYLVKYDKGDVYNIQKLIIE